MSNFNKVVTNLQKSLSNAENDNLSQTLSAVRTAGGGGGGTSYGGDGIYIEIVGNNTITLTTTAAEKLNRAIPTTVAELTDSGDYATKDFADAKYQTKDSMSAYLTTANAASTYQTKDDMSAYATREWTNNGFVSDSELYGVLQDYVNNTTLNTRLLNKQDKLTFTYDNDKISAINGSALAGNGGTTYTPGQYIDITNDEISVTGVVAIDKTSAYDPILLGDANITAVSSRINNRTTWNLYVNATPVVTDTKLTGDNCVTAHTTETSGEWAVGLVQSAYQAIGSVGGIATDVNALKDASAGWNEVSAKLETAQYATDSATFLKQNDLDDYYQKTETSSKDQLTAEFAKYVTSSNVTTQDTDYVMTTTGWKVLTLPGGGMTQVYHDTTLTGDGNANDNQLGVKWETLSGNTIASAEKAGEAQGFRWGDNTYQDTSAALTNLWNAKNHVTLQTANNILTVDNNDNTSATLSAMSYVNNTLNNRAFLPQKACVCLESEITTMATLANGQGMLFFVVSAH